MKKALLSIALVAGSFLSSSILATTSWKDDAVKSISPNITKKDFYKMFFVYAQENEYQIVDDYDYRTINLEEGSLRKFHSYIHALKAITQRDTNALNDMTLEQLRWQNCRINAPGYYLPRKFFPSDKDRKFVSSFYFYIKNAFGVVLAHSTLDKTEEDEALTLKMLEILIAKSLVWDEKDAITSTMFLIADHEYQTLDHGWCTVDYVSSYSLAEFAQEYCSEKVQAFVQTYIR